MKFKLSKIVYALSLTLLAVLLFAALSQSVSIVAAQTDAATVIITPTTGGTTNPLPGEYTYANGTNIVLTATPAQGYEFKYWIVSGDFTPGHTTQGFSYIYDDSGQMIAQFPRPDSSSIDSLVFTTNPTNITCGYGYTYTYTAVFTPTSSNATATTDATVIVMPTNGGTVSPAPGMYTYSNGSNIVLTAIPDSGYAFHYWIISGSYLSGHTTQGFSYIYDDSGQMIAQFPRPDSSSIDSLVFTTNPTNITCGYGYTYTYTAVFTPASTTATPATTASPMPATTPSPEATTVPAASSGTDMTLWIAAAIVVIIVIIVAAAVVLMRRKK